MSRLQVELFEEFTAIGEPGERVVRGEVFHVPPLFLGEDSQPIIFGQIPHVNEVEYDGHQRCAQHREGKVNEQRLVANARRGETP